MDCVLPEKVSAVLYPTYVSAFDPMRTQAAARHMLTASEFAAEMQDPRIDKYIVWNDDEMPIGLTTLTTDLSSIPWVSREYYAARYPAAAAANVLFYLGYILVERSYRPSQALVMMTDQVNLRLAESQGVLGFDMCGYNDASGIGRYTKKLFGSGDRLECLDVQSYYGADYHGLTPALLNVATPSEESLMWSGSTKIAARPVAGERGLRHARIQRGPR